MSGFCLSCHLGFLCIFTRLSPHKARFARSRGPFEKMMLDSELQKGTQSSHALVYVIGYCARILWHKACEVPIQLTYQPNFLHTCFITNYAADRNMDPWTLQRTLWQLTAHGISGIPPLTLPRNPAAIRHLELTCTRSCSAFGPQVLNLIWRWQRRVLHTGQHPTH